MANRDNLGFLGVDFQYKLVYHFMDDKKFFRDTFEIVDNNVFTEVNLRKFVGALKDYYENYDYVPSYSEIEIELRSKTKTEQDLEFILATIDKIKTTSCEGGDSIKLKAHNFFKQQNMVKVHNKMGELLKIGDIERYNELEEMVREAISVGNRDEIGIKLRDNIGEVLVEDYRSVVPTGVGEIDKVLEGGLGKQELAVIIGGSGFGKTTITTAFANHCAENGFKVVQIVFEDKEKQIQRKHIARITEIEARNLSKPENLENVKDIIKNTSCFDDNLIIKKFNTGEISPLKIKNYIKRLINTGFKPDMVIIDYFECLVPSKAMKDQWEAEARMMRELESAASEFEIAMWVATQGNRESMNGELVTLSKAGGSFKKIQIAHIVLTISRTPEDIKNNIATLAVLKNRAGQTSLPIENVYFNNGTCIIDTSRATTYNSHDEYQASEEEKSQDLLREITEKRRKKQQED